MYTWDKSNKGLTTITCSKIDIKVSEDMIAEFEFLYSNAVTNQRLGSCVVPLAVFSKETKEFLADFIKAAEVDFGQIVSGKKLVVEPPSLVELDMPEIDDEDKPLGV